MALVTMPDGQEVDLPDQITPELAARLRAFQTKAAPRKDLSKVDTELTIPERIASALPDIPQPIVDIAAGASGLMRGGANIISEGLGERLFPTAAARDSGYRTAGEILDPVALAVGGGAMKAAQAIPRLNKYAVGAAGGALGGAGVGALSEEGSATTGGLLGGAIGGAIPVIGVLGRKIKDVVAQQFSPAAREAEAGRILTEAAAGRPVIEALESSAPIVSGQTAGQAAVGANAPTFAALQNVVENVNPELAYGRTVAQREARAKEIQSFAKTEQELNKAVQERGTQADVNYAKAFQTALKKDKEISSVLKNPFVVDVLPNVRKLVKAQGGRVSTTEQLQMIKKELDAKIAGSPAGKPSDNETRALIDVQSKLVDWITKNNPDYAIALQEYATASKPIAEMRIGQAAQKIIESPVGGKERAASFVKAVEDEYNLLKKSTGYTRAELSSQLQPANLAKLQNVAKELDIDSRFQEQAIKGRSAIQSQLDIKFQLPSMLNSALTLTNSVLGRLQAGAKEKTLKELSAIMQDPKETARIMRAANEREKNAIRFLQRAQMAGALVGTTAEKGDK